MHRAAAYQTRQRNGKMRCLVKEQQRLIYYCWLRLYCVNRSK